MWWQQLVMPLAWHVDVKRSTIIHCRHELSLTPISGVRWKKASACIETSFHGFQLLLTPITGSHLKKRHQLPSAPKWGVNASKQGFQFKKLSGLRALFPDLFLFPKPKFLLKSLVIILRKYTFFVSCGSEVPFLYLLESSFHVPISHILLHSNSSLTTNPQSPRIHVLSNFIDEFPLSFLFSSLPSALSLFLQPHLSAFSSQPDMLVTSLSIFFSFILIFFSDLFFSILQYFGTHWHRFFEIPILSPSLLYYQPLTQIPIFSLKNNIILLMSRSFIWKISLPQMEEGILNTPSLLTRPKLKAMYTHCLARYKGAPLYPTWLCVHVAFVFGLVCVGKDREILRKRATLKGVTRLAQDGAEKEGKETMMKFISSRIVI
ncbi:hypothetical protein VP01_3781g2 [Puccinia sorghi]|uniref:Uncharacterized protein n=1 Tax=Puccinia sorghi TaxID=27349 RepID=A0A0L6UVI8_9BASI|nr:hypothetical protein VP01_3781g2 [Puccinia sorghi]